MRKPAGPTRHLQGLSFHGETKLRASTDRHSGIVLLQGRAGWAVKFFTFRQFLVAMDQVNRVVLCRLSFGEGLLL